MIAAEMQRLTKELADARAEVDRMRSALLTAARIDDDGDVWVDVSKATAAITCALQDTERL